jgi:serine/threonine-protein kinase
VIVLPYMDSDYELKRIERKLRRGESVTLVGETGLPKWWRWERGAMQLSPVSGNDGSFSIKTEKDSSLMLLPESVVPRSFRLRAQVRHDNATSRGGEVGIYFFRQTDQISENLRAVSSHRITFNDTPFPGLKGPVKALPQFMIYRAQVSLERSGETPIPSSANLANLQFRPADPESPRPWREVILEVTPAGVRCFGAVEGKSRRAFEPELITIRLARERMQKEQARLPASLGLPDLWPDRAFTRGSLGLCVSAGEASFRNVVIEPLRP